jgi:hypothetical protein
MRLGKSGINNDIKTSIIFESLISSKNKIKNLPKITTEDFRLDFFETKLDSNTSLIEANFLREKDQTKDVTFEPKRNSFNVRRISKLIAIADATTKNEWKFLNMDDVEQRALSKNILDVATKKQLGL